MSHTVDLSILSRDFPKDAIKKRKGGGGQSFDYVDGTAVIRRLNEATGNNWSFSVDRYWTEANVTLALVTLTIPGHGSRQHIGVQSADGRVGEDAAAKGAITDALKKAATLFGVALHLYGPDYESASEAPPQAPGEPERSPMGPRAASLNGAIKRADTTTVLGNQWKTVEAAFEQGGITSGELASLRIEASKQKRALLAARETVRA